MMKEFETKERYGFNDLVRIMEILRAPGGCPWDREQTHESIRKNLIEETYEVCEGIDKKDNAILCEELGDLLLQVVFHAQMAREEGGFTMDDVADGICKKLIRRHPHIFADKQAGTAEQVLEVWDQIKQAEKGGKQTAAEKMAHVYRGMPALMRAQKVQSRAAKVGFDWDSAEEAAEKIAEETKELFAAKGAGDAAEIKKEAGDLLFACVNVVRKCGVESDEALTGSTDKFIRRFAAVEERVEKDGKKMEEMTLTELDRYWDEVKREEQIDANR